MDVSEPAERAQAAWFHGLAAAARDGAVQAVLFPSPDGFHLHRSLGFTSVPVRPDRCFYLH
ncbi:hypothetical protein [Actinoplanes sp. NPDC023714]|uniref:hypothetical protein n=1 Tax=Actinoplanes sp. NPDC023714 TaxID=3154322 RepID=UPI0033D17CAA